MYGGKLNADTQFPWMLHVGDDVELTAGVRILNHDYSWSVVKARDGRVLGGVGPVWIGDNVFVGTNATILMNTRIGDNCIVGAMSLVSGEFPPGSVIAGCPARVVCTLDEYIEKRRRRQLGEAQAIVRAYRKAFGRNPTRDKLPAYFWLFEPRGEETLHPVFRERLALKNNYERSLALFQATKPEFASFEAFLASVPEED